MFPPIIRWFLSLPPVGAENRRLTRGRFLRELFERAAAQGVEVREAALRKERQPAEEPGQAARRRGGRGGALCEHGAAEQPRQVAAGRQPEGEGDRLGGGRAVPDQPGKLPFELAGVGQPPGRRKARIRSARPPRETPARRIPRGARPPGPRAGPRPSPRPTRRGRRPPRSRSRRASAASPASCPGGSAPARKGRRAPRRKARPARNRPRRASPPRRIPPPAGGTPPPARARKSGARRNRRSGARRRRVRRRRGPPRARRNTASTPRRGRPPPRAGRPAHPPAPRARRRRGRTMAYHLSVGRCAPPAREAAASGWSRRRGRCGCGYRRIRWGPRSPAQVTRRM